MEELDKLRHWSYHRQYLNKQGTNALDVLKEICAVYSWHPSAALSLRARLKSFSPEDFRKLNASASITRIPCMRLSVHLLPADYAPGIMAATVPSDPAYWEKRYSQDGRKIPAGSYASIKKAVLETATEPMEPAEIAKASGVDESIIKFVLNRLGYEGYIARVGSEGICSNKISYVSAKSRHGRFFSAEDQAASLQWLAEKYLKAFGPARIKDFQWWAGITVSKAREAILSLDCEKLIFGKEELYLPSELSEAYRSFETSGKEQLDVLPQWDAYTMGYAPDGRQRFVDPEYQRQIYGAIGATGGNGLGTILSGGRAVASWDQKLKGTKLNLNVNPFKKLSSSLAARIEKEFNEISEFYGTKKMELTISSQVK